MPRGQKASPHHRGRRNTHFLVRTSTIFGADVHDPKGCRKTLYKKKVCVYFLAPILNVFWGNEADVGAALTRVDTRVSKEEKEEAEPSKSHNKA